MPRGRQRTQIARIEAEAQEANSGDATSQETETAYKNAIAAREKSEEELTKAEENVKAAEQKVSELEEGATSIEATSSDEESITEEKKELTFGDVKTEDVKVYYEVLTNRDEVNADESGEVQPNYEEREAQVGSLSNNDGSITLSFTDPDAATNATDFYIVVIDALSLRAPVYVDITQPVLTAESDVKSDSESCDVTIQAQDATFATDLGAGDLTLGGSFEGMSVTGAEAAGTTLTVHLNGTPAMNYEEASTYMDGQITVPASGFENSASGATAYVDIALPEEAFNVGDAEVLDPVSAIGYVDYVSFDGDTANATVYLYADLGIFNDVKPESIALDGCFTDGKVESVSKENESDYLLKVEVSFPAKGVDEDDYNLAGTLKLTAADALKEVKGLRAVVTSLDTKVTEGLKEARENRYTQTSVRLKQMQDSFISAKAMFAEGATMLANRKENPMKAPGENATEEEVIKYNAEPCEKRGTRLFKSHVRLLGNMDVHLVQRQVDESQENV